MTDVEINQRIADIEGLNYAISREPEGLQVIAETKWREGTIPCSRHWLFAPVNNWDQGGPLIEKYKCSITREGNKWIASIGHNSSTGKSLLQAAMLTILICHMAES